MRTACAAFVVLLAAVAALVHTGQPNDEKWHLMLRIALAYLAFVVAVIALRRAPARTVVPLVLVGGFALQVVAMTSTPRATDDFYRYAWDGRVQSAGIDPYRYTPVDPALARLRDPWLFPPECRERVCTRMNHPRVHTIYPPVAQAAFVTVDALSPRGARSRPIQIFAATVALLVTALVLLLLHRGGRDPRWAALWAWSPLTVYETGNNAHVDVLAVLFTLAALAAVAARRQVLGGVLLGLAVATKILPLLVLPAAVRTSRVRVPLVLVGTVVAVYVPHLLAVGTHVLGFLPGYLSEEGYSGGRRWALLRLVLPDVLGPFVGLAILGAVSLHVALRGDPGDPWTGATLVTGTAFVVAGPPYPWYVLLLTGLVAMSGRWEWLAVGAASYQVYFAPALKISAVQMQRLSYALALAIVLGVMAWRADGSRTAGVRMLRLVGRNASGQRGI